MYKTGQNFAQAILKGSNLPSDVVAFELYRSRYHVQLIVPDTLSPEIKYRSSVFFNNGKRFTLVNHHRIVRKIHAERFAAGVRSKGLDVKVFEHMETDVLSRPVLEELELDLPRRKLRQSHAVLPVDALSEICKHVDDRIVAGLLNCTSKTTARFMLTMTLRHAREIREHERRLAVGWNGRLNIHQYCYWESHWKTDDDMYTLLDVELPEFPYGIPDHDANGRLVPAHKVSNDLWYSVLFSNYSEIYKIEPSEKISKLVEMMEAQSENADVRRVLDIFKNLLRRNNH